MAACSRSLPLRNRLCRLLWAGVLAVLAWGQPVFAATQVCTTQNLGNKDFLGISGSSDNHIIAVGKNGNIAQWDGATWTNMVSPSTEELRDVEVVDSNNAWAVGKKGTILQMSLGLWAAHTGVTGDDLNGVWSDSANEAWVVGEKGALWYFNGVTWSDQEAAAGSNNVKMEDAWGDASQFYALGEDGELFRFDRNTMLWDPPDNNCNNGKTFEDLWGDTAGNLYLVRKKEIYFYDGAVCTQVATSNEDLRGVYGWNDTGDVYAVGKKGTVVHWDGSTWTETQEAADDFRDAWVSDTGNAYYTGKKGELTTCQCIDCVLPQFAINHDSFGIHCLDESITADIFDANTGTPIIDYNNQVTLDTQNGVGTWSLAAGSGTLMDATANDGLATYDWALGESSATFLLSYREGPATFNIDVFDTLDPGIRDNDAEGDIAFSASGFTVTSAALSNPPPGVISPFAGPVVAGTDVPVHLAAFGQTATDPLCGVIETYTGPQSLKFWTTFIDPTPVPLSLSVDALPVASVEAAAVAQAVVFAAGQATVTMKYKDVGLLQLLMKDDTSGHPDLPAGIRGATAGFVSLPDHFELSAILNSGGLPNPAAADENGAVFSAAGQPFSVTVTAVDADGDPTPSYGQESMPESVALSGNLVAPSPGNNPAVTAATGFGAFVGGTATGSDFLWPEVGIITLTPAVGDGNYLGAGNVAGTTSGNVGRFIPDHFTVVQNAPQLQTSCAAGAYTHIGESFGFATAPLATLTARAFGGAITTNYNGDYFKITNLSLQNRSYSAASGTLNSSAVPLPATDPLISDLGGGVATLAFSAGGGLRFDRAAPIAPFSADIQLSIDVLDADAVAALSNPVAFGNPGGIAFTAGREMRYGRVRLVNAVGSERLDLPVPMRSEYFFDAATGFVTATTDVCSGSISLGLGSFTANLGAGETCVQDNGAPGDSSAGCVAPGPLAERYAEPPLSGDFNLWLAAPGDGNDGSVAVSADVPVWLEFDWDSATAGDEDPVGTATFGIYPGNPRRIYTREVY